MRHLAIGRPGWQSRCAWLLVLLAVALSGGALAGIARADGDPASDYLLTNHVFLSSQLSSVSSSQRQLIGLVQAANRDGFAIRVAIISSEYDLGSITALWRKPRIYARFLGLELGSAHKQRLLVVMPDGLGFNWPDHSIASAYQLLARIRIEPGGAGPTSAAQTAVLRLAADAGITLTPPTKARTHATRPVAHSDGRAVILAVAVVALALLIALRRRRHADPKTPSAPSGTIRPASPLRLRWAVPGFVILGGAAVAVPIVALKSFRHVSAASGVPVGSVVTPPPFTWGPW